MPRLELRGPSPSSPTAEVSTAGSLKVQLTDQVGDYVTLNVGSVAITDVGLSTGDNNVGNVDVLTMPVVILGTSTAPIGSVIVSTMPTVTVTMGPLEASTANIGDVDVLTLVGDNVDMDTDPGTDGHAGVAVLLPAAGGHVIGGTVTNPFRAIISNSTAASVFVTVVNATAGNLLASVTVPSTTTVGITTIPATTTVGISNIPSTTTVGITTIPSTTSVIVVNATAANLLTTVSGTVTANIPATTTVSITSIPSTSTVGITTIPSTTTVGITTIPATTTVIVTNVTAASLVVTIGSSVIGTNSVTIQGATAHDSAVVGNPLLNGFYAISAEQTAVADGDVVRVVADLTGKAIVLPYANPENYLVGTTAAITGTGDTAIVVSQATGVRTYITHLTITNSSSAGTWVNLKDGSTVIYTAYAASGGGGVAATFPVPLKGTAATQMYITCEATAAVRASVVGYKGI